MRLGNLTREVKIIRRVQVGTSGLNTPIYEWPVIGIEWAELIHKSEDEKHAAAQTYAERVVTFRMHFRDDITEVDRLECDGNTYNIIGQRELGYQEGLEISAKWMQ